MSDVMGVVMILLVGGGAWFLWQQGFFEQFLQPKAAPAAAEPAPAAAAPAAAPAPYSCPSGQTLDSTTNKCIDDAAVTAATGCHGVCKGKSGQICCLSTTNNNPSSFEGLVGLDSYDQYFTGASSKNSSSKKSKNKVACAADLASAKALACDPTGAGGILPTGTWPFGTLPPTAAVTPEEDAFFKSDDKDTPFSTYGNAPEINAFRDPSAKGKSSDKTNKGGNYSIDHYVKKQQNFKATGFGTLGGAGYTDDPEDYELGFGFYASRVRPSI